MNISTGTPDGSLSLFDLFVIRLVSITAETCMTSTTVSYESSSEITCSYTRLIEQQNYNYGDCTIPTVFRGSRGFRGSDLG